MSSRLGGRLECGHSKNSRKRDKSESPHSQEAPTGLSHQVATTHQVVSADLMDWSQFDIDLDPELRQIFNSNVQLRNSYRDSIRGIKNQLDVSSIRAFVETDSEDPSVKRPVLEIVCDYESVDGYREIKSSVREVVRDCEDPETLIYTRINRPQ
jgi:hypothetical protein